MSVITTIEELRILAQKRVPRMFYDYADSGSWTESTYRANESDFQKIKLRQRVAVNMDCLLYTSPSPRDRQKSRMPSSA